ncbi:MAG: Na+/H+ antiporter NhaA [Planctomycetes bacterium]|nr:Na+/H+ antiporter NhaA [Planctomycetota bacterium]
MSNQANGKVKAPLLAFLLENSLFLIAGAVGALVWANVDEATYHHFIHFDMRRLFVEPSDEPHAERHTEPARPSENAHSGGSPRGPVGDPGDTKAVKPGHPSLTIHFLVNDVLMALFFAIAAKEVWESLLPGGALSNFRKAATPLLATAGGVVGPAIIYASGAFLLGEWASLGRGWAIPCATDIAFSYLVARLVFGNGHPAIAFLLLLAIADDAAGLVILAVFYPSATMVLSWLLLAAAAIGLCFVLRAFRLHSFWWYLVIPGTMSWISFYLAGVHPALGLVPIIPCMPHAHTDLGAYARGELGRLDTLSEFQRWWKNPVELILGLFGLVNAGVVFSSIGHGTWLVMCGLLIGKPVGITLLTWFAERGLKTEIPAGMTYRHVVSLGCVAAIGFTVALFVSTAAFPTPGPVQDSVKMGALFSFSAAILSFIVARILGVRPEGRPSPFEDVGDEATLDDAAR